MKINPDFEFCNGNEIMVHRYNLTPSSKEKVVHQVFVDGNLINEYTRKKTIFKDSTGKEFVWQRMKYREVKRDGIIEHLPSVAIVSITVDSGIRL